MKIQWTAFPSCVLLLISGLSRSEQIFRPPNRPYEMGNFQILLRAGVNYGDIQRLNATCSGMDSCRIPRTDDPWKYNCNCDDTCSYFGSCCVDSKFRNKYRQKNSQTLECRKLNNRRDFLYPWVRTCNPDMRYDNTTAELCMGRGCKLNDALVEIPVTDPLTGITYNNYFCFACNENSGEERLIPWNVAVGIGGIGGTLEKINRSTEIPTLQNYEKDFWQWVADNDNSTTYSIWPAIPEELEDVLPFCFAFNIVADCASDWTDEDVSKLCQSYMALTRIFNGTSETFIGTRYKHRYYRNPHCGICNHESLESMVCVAEREYPKTAPGGLLPSGDFFVRIFSLHDKLKECGDRMIYDKTSKKCRNTYRARKLE